MKSRHGREGMTRFLSVNCATRNLLFVIEKAGAVSSSLHLISFRGSAVIALPNKSVLLNGAGTFYSAAFLYAAHLFR